MPSPRAIVIGCGISGLTTALCLQQAGREVEIVAADLPPATTSAVAAAFWYPYLAFPRERVLQWSARTFEVLTEEAHHPLSGVWIAEARELFRSPRPDPWWVLPGHHFERVSAQELPEGYAGAHRFSVPVAEMPLYLDHLWRRFVGRGGVVRQRRLERLSELGGAPVVNCAGLGSMTLADDRTLAPIRGQIVRVANPGLRSVLLDEDNPGGDTYVVPRSKDCVLGGTAIESDWSTAPDPATATAIRDRCLELEPRLREAPVLGHQVGLRPGRPSVRVEREPTRSGQVLVHNYGHGGAGLTLSWGCAEEAAALALS
jgi:D-amino-acid oxidase